MQLLLVFQFSELHDPDTDNFHSLNSSSILVWTQVYLWYNFHEDPISNFYIKLQQTDKCWRLHNLLGEGSQ